MADYTTKYVRDACTQVARSGTPHYTSSYLLNEQIKRLKYLGFPMWLIDLIPYNYTLSSSNFYEVVCDILSIYGTVGVNLCCEVCNVDFLGELEHQSKPSIATQYMSNNNYPSNTPVIVSHNYNADNIFYISNNKDLKVGYVCTQNNILKVYEFENVCTYCTTSEIEFRYEILLNEYDAKLELVCQSRECFKEKLLNKIVTHEKMKQPPSDVRKMLCATQTSNSIEEIKYGPITRKKYNMINNYLHYSRYIMSHDCDGPSRFYVSNNGQYYRLTIREEDIGLFLVTSNLIYSFVEVTATDDKEDWHTIKNYKHRNKYEKYKKTKKKRRNYERKQKRNKDKLITQSEVSEYKNVFSSMSDKFKDIAKEGFTEENIKLIIDILIPVCTALGVTYTDYPLLSVFSGVVAYSVDADISSVIFSFIEIMKKSSLKDITVGSFKNLIASAVDNWNSFKTNEHAISAVTLIGTLVSMFLAPSYALSMTFSFFSKIKDVVRGYLSNDIFGAVLNTIYYFSDATSHLVKTGSLEGFWITNSTYQSSLSKYLNVKANFESFRTGDMELFNLGAVNEFIHDTQTLHEDLDKLRRTCAPRDRPAISRMFVDISTIMQEFNSLAKHNSFRPCPYMYVLAGPSSITKTTIMNMLNKQIAHTNNFQYSNDYINYHNPLDPYWSGHKNHKTIFVYDETAATRPEARGPSELLYSEFICRFANNMPMNLAGASIEDKGKKFVHYLLYSSSTNNSTMYLEHDTVIMSAAMRRFHLFVTCGVKDEYKEDRLDCKDMDNKPFSCKLDFNKMSEEQRSSAIKDVWEFTIWNVDLGDMDYTEFMKDDFASKVNKQKDVEWRARPVVYNGKTMKRISVVELLDYASEHSKQHFANQQFALADQERILNAPMCKYCGLFEEACTCTCSTCNSLKEYCFCRGSKVQQELSVQSGFDDMGYVDDTLNKLLISKAESRALLLDNVRAVCTFKKSISVLNDLIKNACGKAVGSLIKILVLMWVENMKENFKHIEDIIPSTLEKAIGSSVRMSKKNVMVYGIIEKIIRTIKLKKYVSSASVVTCMLFQNYIHSNYYDGAIERLPDHFRGLYENTNILKVLRFLKENVYWYNENTMAYIYPNTEKFSYKVPLFKKKTLQNIERVITENTKLIKPFVGKKIAKLNTIKTKVVKNTKYKVGIINRRSYNPFYTIGWYIDLLILLICYLPIKQISYIFFTLLVFVEYICYMYPEIGSICLKLYDLELKVKQSPLWDLYDRFMGKHELTYVGIVSPTTKSMSYAAELEKQDSPSFIRDEIGIYATLYGVISSCVEIYRSLPVTQTLSISQTESSELAEKSRWYKAYTQSVKDHASVEQISNEDELTNVLRNNTYHISSGNEQFLSCKALGICSYVLMIPRHFYEQAKDTLGNINIRYHRYTADMTQPDGTWMISKDNISFIGGDIVLVHAKTGALKNIVRYFPKTNTQYDKLQVCAGKVLFKNNVGEYRQIVAQDFAYNSNISVSGAHSNVEGFTYWAVNHPGLSGGVVIDTTRTHSYILGIHVAGNETDRVNPTYSACQTVYREQIENSIKEMPHKFVVDTPEPQVKLYAQNLLERIPVHPKSALHSSPHIEGLSYVGSIVKRKTNTGRIIPTLIKEDIRKPLNIKQDWKCAPISGLGQFKDPNYPYITMLNKRKRVSLPLEALQWARDDTVRDLKEAFYKDEDRWKNTIRVLTDDEIVNGIDNMNFCNSMNMSTAMGIGVEALQNVTGKEGNTKRSFAQQDISGNYTFDEAVMDEFNRRLDILKSGSRTYEIADASPKVCAVTLEQYDKGKVRTFYGINTTHQMLIRRTFLTLSEFLCSNPDASSVMVGINPHSVMWHQFAMFLQEVNANNYIAIDIKDFDLSAQPEGVDMVCDILLLPLEWSGNFNEEEMRIAYTIVHFEVTNCLINMNGDVIEMPNIIISGSNLTSLIGCLLNLLYLKSAYYLIMQDTDVKKIEEPFNKYVRMGTYGDDSLGNVSNEIKQYNVKNIINKFSKYGLSATNSRKNTDSIIFEKLSEIQFLKRGFKYDSSYGFYVAPLDEESIHKMLSVIVEKTTSPKIITAQNVATAMNEIKYHGRAKYMKYKKVLRITCEKHGLITCKARHNDEYVLTGEILDKSYSTVVADWRKNQKSHPLYHRIEKDEGMLSLLRRWIGI